MECVLQDDFHRSVRGWLWLRIGGERLALAGGELYPIEEAVFAILPVYLK